MTQRQIPEPNEGSAAPPTVYKWEFGGLVAAGYRFERSQKYFTIQHLGTGRWARLETGFRPGKEGQEPTWRMAWLLSPAEYLPALHAVAAESDPDRMVTGPELAELLIAAWPLAADEPEAPAFPVPRVGEVFAYAHPEHSRYFYRYPYAPYFRNLDDDVFAILAVATALAWRGGEALERDLRAELASLGWDAADSRTALRLAALRTGRNIQCDSRDRLWLMRRAWHEREYEAIERRLPPPETINTVPPPKRRLPPTRGA